MQLGSSPSRWQFRRVLEYVVQVERAYAVSLKFWVNFKAENGVEPILYLYATGSGRIFDLLPEAHHVKRAEVNELEENNLGEALYYATLHLEMHFNKTREPVGPRPSL